jgi:hypothetical protein
MPIPFKPFPDADSYLGTSSEAIATGGLDIGRIPMNVQISTEELSGVNYFPSLQKLLIAANNTKIYIVKQDSILQPNIKRLNESLLNS